MICKEAGLPGPSVESQLLCIHKYYNRMTEPSKLWYEAIDLDNQEDWHGSHIKYPCFIKTPFMFRSIGLFIVRDESEMVTALSACKHELTPWFKLLCPLFEKYINVAKYPLILKNIVLVEELVEDGSIHCIEGWADENGKLSVWLTTDNSYFSKPKKTGDAFIVPSQLPCTFRQNLEVNLLDKIRNYGLRSTFFNVEFWCRENGERIDIVEINNRICCSYTTMQCKLYGTSSHYGALYLACGEMEKLERAHSLVVCGLEQKIVAGMFLTSLYLKHDTKAATILDFEELRLIKAGKVEGIASVTIDFNEDFTIRSVTNGARFIGNVFAFKPSLKELLDVGDEVRCRLVKNNSLLGFDREKEYLQLCGLCSLPQINVGNAQSPPC